VDIHPDDPDLARLGGEGRVVAYFGYGSLVNRLTLRTKFLAIRRAEVVGWRRFWTPRGDGSGPALLSVAREEGEVLQGVVVYDHADHLPAVDEREVGYDRRVVELDRVTIEAPPLAGVPLHIYEAPRLAVAEGADAPPILQSYLDAVLQGFLALYGDAGVRRFVSRTEGFARRIVTDRDAPRYPRAVALSADEAALFDRLAREAGARLVQPD
jgi:hypothetical protein